MKISIKKNRAGIDVYRPDGKVDSLSEDGEAINFYNAATFRWPEKTKTLFHVTNEGKRSFNQARKLKEAGLKKGVSDYIMMMPSGEFTGFALELKRADKGDASVEQKKFLNDVIEAGGYACIAYGCEAALLAIENYFNKFIKK